MVPEITRRNAIIGIGSVATGSIATSVFSQNTKAASVEISDLNVENTNKEISSPVNRVNLIVNGTYSYDTSIIPDTVILRLEATDTNEYTQLDATKITNNLAESYTGEYNLKGNILDIPTIGHDDVNPINIGDTKSLSLDARVSMTVKNNGRDIHHTEITDSFKSEINKTTATVTSEINGTGNVEVITS